MKTASSVGEPFDKMGKVEYYVVVSDHHMPGKGGLQFLKELRYKGNHISFVLFSGEDKDEIKIEASCFGADRYFNKICSLETGYGDLSKGIESAKERAKRNRS